MITCGRINFGKTLLLKLFGHVGDLIGYHDWSFRGHKKLKIETFTFSKVVYRPLGYYLLSPLSIFSPEINSFEKSKEYFSNIFFAYIFFIFLYFQK